MMPDGEYDAIVIGAGQAGVPLSQALARAGWRTALIEMKHVGGTCVNEGCTPTKTMVASARVAYLARRSSDYGVSTGPVHVDLAAVQERKRAIVDSFRSGSRRRLEDTDGLDLWIGEGRFISPGTVEVRLSDGASRHFNSNTIFINTGARPRVPELAGLEDVPWLDSTSIMELQTLPRHLLILGGGYIGLEFGQMFRRFGSDVTIVHRGPQLLSREDADVASEVLGILRQDGITVHLNANATAVKTDDGALALETATPDGRQTVAGTHLLVAIGRVPNTERLNLAAAGVTTDERGFVVVDHRLQTNVQGVYALGDVKGGPAFTHISYDDFRVIRSDLLEGGNASTLGRLVPYTVFIDPQLGRVGMSEREAKRNGLRYGVAKLPMTHVARALEVEESRGFIKAIVDSDTDQILGAAVLGVEGGEIMSILQMAMMGQVPYTVIRDAVFAHPTLAESLNNLFAAIDH
jgi:pyruvate/2-oxoglutarate dehydrogenase complex dihydrolipoamide dehydrogenase (E3) component